jgi:hypothetical protein
MPNDWDDDDIDFDQEPSALIKDLRNQLKAQAKANKELTERIAALEPQVRGASLSSILSDLKVKDPRVAKLIPKDLDVNKENVEAWLDEYGDLFNIKTEEAPGAESAQEQPPVEDNSNEDWKRFQAQSGAPGANTPDTESQQIAMLIAADKASGGSIDKFNAMLRGDLPIPS